MLLLITRLALAARVDPGIEQVGVEAAFQEWAAAKGEPSAKQALACRPFAEGIELCFSRIEGDTRRYYTRADGLSVEALEAKAAGRAEDALVYFVAVPVDGFTGSYWLTNEGDGRDHAALLFPQALAKRFGEHFVVAVPVRGVLVVWVPGDAEFDKAVAVGVSRMYETLPDSVSPRIYTWDGAKWVTWGEAKVQDVPPPSDLLSAPADHSLLPPLRR